jgi:hypothetical protein
VNERGEKVAVVISIEEYEKSSKSSKTSRIFGHAMKRKL